MALAGFGRPSRYVTVLPDNNAVTDALKGELVLDSLEAMAKGGKSGMPAAIVLPVSQNAPRVYRPHLPEVDQPFAG